MSSTKKVKHLQVGDCIFLPQQQSIVTVTKVTNGVWDEGRAVGIKWAEGFTVLTEDDEVTFY